MGQTGSNFVKKMASPFTGWSGSGSDTGKSGRQLMLTPFVYSRQGSMYFDDEGDLAHEFYEEVVPKAPSSKREMRRLSMNNLVPQGEVSLPHPRLHVDFPVILCEAPVR